MQTVKNMAKDGKGHGPLDVMAAWGVHIFTASGIVWGFLAVVAIWRGNESLAFLWLGVALFVDGIDGALARKVRVSEVTPQVDGRTLDNVIDYFNYVAVPAMMIYWFNLVPEGWRTVTACAISIVSLYTFANNSVKSDDYYFVGFPAVWNLVVLYFVLLGTSLWLNLAVIAICLLLTPTHIHFVHPLRVRHMRPVTILAAIVWGVTTLILTLEYGGYIGAGGAYTPVVFWLWVISGLWFLAISVWRSLQQEDAGPA